MPGPGWTFEDPMFIALSELRRVRIVRLYYYGFGIAATFDDNEGSIWILNVRDHPQGYFLIARNIGELNAVLDCIFAILFRTSSI